MKRVSSARLLAALVAGSFLVAACSSDGSSSTDTAAETTTADTSGSETTADGTDTTAVETTVAGSDAWAVNTEDCIDPAAAEAPIEGTIKIGSTMPLSGNGPAAAAFAPVKAGFESYVKYANENKLLGDLTVEAVIEDDQYDEAKTQGAVSKAIDAGANLFSGMVGTPNNLAARGTLNEECIPQLNALTGSPAWGEVEDYPWTTGLLVPYPLETNVYAQQIAEQFPDGAKVALFYVNSDFGQAYADALNDLAPDYNIEIVDSQTIEAGDNEPPVAQLTSIASKKPDVILAVPLGFQCITYLTELASAKAQNAGWTPATFITNTCASSLILGAAGAAADGLYTSNNLKDVTAPANADDPAVKEYIDYMTANGNGEVLATAAAGWTAAEVTIAMVKQAMESPDGLSRASIINAARSFTYTPSLARDGVVDTMNGADDPFLSESLQVLQYAAGPATFTDIGSLITEFETK